MQKFITIKEYARKNKINIYNAVKLVKSGKVENKTEIIDGKEQLFIKDKQIKQEKEKIEKEPTIEELHKEIKKLKERVSKLEATQNIGLF